MTILSDVDGIPESLLSKAQIPDQAPVWDVADTRRALQHLLQAPLVLAIANISALMRRPSGEWYLLGDGIYQPQRDEPFGDYARRSVSEAIDFVECLQIPSDQWAFLGIPTHYELFMFNERTFVKHHREQ